MKPFLSHDRRRWKGLAGLSTDIILTDLIERTKHFRIDGQVNLVIIVSQKSNNQIILQLIKI